MAYSRLPHLEQVFAGMSRRVKRSNPLGEAFDAVRERYDELSRDFDEFFPELRAKVGAEH